MFFLMDESMKIDLLFRASDEARAIREEAKQKVAGVYRQLCRDLENEAGLSHQEAIYELYLLGVRLEEAGLEA
jgi:vacuolar-type H+-ATPase subunit E/Vma4